MGAMIGVGGMIRRGERWEVGGVSKEMDMGWCVRCVIG